MQTSPEARDWELENLARYNNGEISEAELGMANVIRAGSDPQMIREIVKMMSDPRVQQLIADPTFQAQAEELRKVSPKKQKTSSQLASLLFAMSPAGAHPGTVRTSNVKMETNADLQVLAKKVNPAVGYFDPLKLGSDERGEAFIGFMRHAEIKHGRVAMAAFVGYCITANGLRWPAEPFMSIGGNSPMEQFDALPQDTKWNLVLGVGLLEGWGELRGTGEPHYMRGGKPGYYPPFDEVDKKTLFGYYPGLNLWDPLKIAGKMSPEKSEKKLIAEINNGRLAMLGIAAFISEAKIPGSVPLLNGIVEPYNGDVVLPPGMVGWFAK
jgi:hypothetical protein